VRKKITVGKKLLAGFSAMIILLVLVSANAVWNMTRMENQAKDINDNWMPSVEILGQIRSEFIDVQRLTLRLVLEDDNKQEEDLESRIHAEIEDLQKKQKKYESLITSEEERKLYETFVSKENEYFSHLPSIIQAGRANDFQKANELVKEARTSANDSLDALSKDLDLNVKNSAQVTSNSVQTSQAGKTFVITFSILAIVVGLGVAFLISRIISKPLILLAKATKQISSGDLTVGEIRIKNRDEIGDLAISFNEMTTNLRHLIQQVVDSSQQVAASSEELTASAELSSQATEHIAKTIQEIAAGAEQQAHTVEETSHIISEMATGIQQIALNSENAAFTAIRASEAATEGNSSIQEAISQMNSIHATVSEMAHSIKELGEQARYINQIAETITNIAAQTNLLALNAAIEAARAGEQGRGFAVVANEVRKLAEESAQSSQQIGEYIATIHEGIQAVIQSMEIGTKEVSHGIDVIHMAGDSFEKIRQEVNEVATQIQEVSATVQKMAEGSTQVVKSMQEISEVALMSASGTQNVSAATEEQLATMEEISTSSHGLAKMAEELQAMIGKFKI
jgi:methyl-accepting chemotaxis protein